MIYMLDQTTWEVTLNYVYSPFKIQKLKEYKYNFMNVYLALVTYKTPGSEITTSSRST